jgi:hypothetical protein
MQPDLERLLRESRSVLPDPDPASTGLGIGLVLARIDPGRGSRRVGLFSSAAIFGLLAASLAVAAARITDGVVVSGAGSASRVVDRTLLCRPFGEGFPDPVRVMDARAGPRITKNAPGAAVNNGFEADGVSAGFYTGPYYGHPTGAVYLSRTNCSQTKLRVPLSTSRLRGGQLRFSARYQCDVPARVLVRVRAVFTRPVALTREPGATYLSSARGRITTASLAVTTVRGRSIVFASVDDATGRARLFTSASRCSPT